MNTDNTKKFSMKEIDFRALTKECKTQKDLSVLTKEFMKNMIEGML